MCHKNCSFGMSGRVECRSLSSSCCAAHGSKALQRLGIGSFYMLMPELVDGFAAIASLP